MPWPNAIVACGCNVATLDTQVNQALTCKQTLPVQTIKPAEVRNMQMAKTVDQHTVSAGLNIRSLQLQEQSGQVVNTV